MIDTKTSSTKAVDLFLKRWSSLNWQSPFQKLPHGWSGATVMSSGLYFLIQALLIGPDVPGGYDITGPQPRPLFLLFVTASAVNAIAGLILTKTKSPKPLKLPFYLGGSIQLSLTWFCFRFALQSSRQYSFVGSMLDKTFGLILFGILALLLILPFMPDKSNTPFLIRIPVMLFGSFSFSLTCFYPFQMALFGHEWFDCVMEQYPWQQAGFVSYVYVPTLFGTAGIFFGLTLYIRKILSLQATSTLIVGFIVPILVATVLTQEVHISEVSTQQLIIMCKDDGNDDASLLATAAKFLDTSALARTILKALGIAMKTPPGY